MSKEEPGIDYHWYRRLCEVFEETSMPKTIHEAIRDLHLLGVDVSKLTLQLNKIKSDWIHQDLLKAWLLHGSCPCHLHLHPRRPRHLRSQGCE
eukprot:Skav200310  [mRNA]  locus=scaffold4329:192246:192659:- [translate_table: standard]